MGLMENLLHTLHTLSMTVSLLGKQIDSLDNRLRELEAERATEAEVA